MPCGARPSPVYATDLARFVQLLTANKPPSADYRKVALPKPPTLPDMPDAAHAPARPASSGVPMPIDLATIALPKRSADRARRGRGGARSGDAIRRRRR